jgi:hypothetical protein
VFGTVSQAEKVSDRNWQEFRTCNCRYSIGTALAQEKSVLSPLHGGLAMMIGTREVIRATGSCVAGNVQAGAFVAAPGEEAEALVPTRRREVRVEEQKLCTYELCESMDKEAVVIQQGEVYSLNRSAHGILIIMGYAPRPQQLIELHIPESKWRRSLNLFEVQWTKPVHVEAQGDLFLVGCHLTFGPSQYWAF